MIYIYIYMTIIHHVCWLNNSKIGYIYRLSMVRWGEWFTTTQWPRAGMILEVERYMTGLHVACVCRFNVYCLVVSTYPSVKYEFVSWDDDIPNIWNKMFQTTNQYIYIHLHTCIEYFSRDRYPQFLTLPKPCIQRPTPNTKHQERVSAAYIFWRTRLTHQNWPTLRSTAGEILRKTPAAPASPSNKQFLTPRYWLSHIKSYIYILIYIYIYININIY